MKALASLRERILQGPQFSEEFYYLFYKAWASLSSLTEEERYGESFFYAFSHLTPCISPGEKIVGKRDLPMGAAEQKEWEDHYRPLALARVEQAGRGQDSHMAVDYPLLLNRGVCGILAQIDKALKDCKAEKTAFYRCCKRCLEGVLVHAEAYARLAQKLSEETEDPQEKLELQELASICRRVPAQPAESFHEALQSVHFITHCLSLDPYRMCPQQFQLGHPDRYLWPFYQKELQEGSLSRERAQLLLDHWALQINFRIPHGLSGGYMLGGRNERGEIVENELTELCLQVIDDLALVYPAVGLCWTEGMSEAYLDKACELLAKGHSHPAIFNDEVIRQGLMHYGVSEAEAANYIHSTCVEITPVASSNVWVASPYTNLPRLLLKLMDGDYPSFEALTEAYFRLLDERIERNFHTENQNRAVRAEHCIHPLLSCFVNDCLARGVDIEQGGARYNWIPPSFVGMANLIDSLYAVKQCVFEEKRFTLRELKEILDQNFEHHEALRLHLLQRIPKYGNDLDEVDSYYRRFTEHIAEECEKYRGMHGNANLIPSVFCWIMHERFGRDTGATPDGRKAGFPLGDGSGPCQGREWKGPTASLLSSTKWDHSRFIGGVAVNLKFSKSSLGTASLSTLKSLIRTYLQRGGFELQINVVDDQTLRQAQASPELYRDLVVRIGGYSDYFVKLSPQMQEEVILRTAHES